LPDPERISARLEALWQIARGPGGGADRPAFSEAEAEAMLLVAGWAREAGLEPGIDRFGNLWALPAAWSGPVFTTGSHVDTVPDGGRYDGALGTVLGLELVHDLSADDVGALRPGVLVCAAEEAPRFGAGTIGSRLLAGTLSDSGLEQIRDAEGISAADARQRYLQRLDELPRIDPPTSRLHAHAEVHVAQRRALRQLGVVTRVASPRRLLVQIIGQAGHSGEVAMGERHDALTASAEVVLAVEAAALAEPPETVGTVGNIEIAPGVVSVIPCEARLTVDLRAISGSSLDRLETQVRARTARIARRRGVGAEVTLVRGGEPVALDQNLAQAALQAARGIGIVAIETWSGAGHDAQHLASLFPTLLLFVPLHGGESHTPREGADMEEILQAATLVSQVVLTARDGCERTGSGETATRRP
jgi:hydantoinase/carbamoylase family amidase